MVEECSLSEGRKDFFKTFCIGSWALVAHRRSNAFSRYLEVTEYGQWALSSACVLGSDGR